MPSKTATADSRLQYYRMQRQAQRQDFIARLQGKSNDLLPYEAIAHLLKSFEHKQLTEQRFIPLAKIVGSVGRYREFTREFLPREGISFDRWAGIDAAMTGASGVPPIEVYQLGDVYFVADGNHRVSVARTQGGEFIDAEVISLKSRLPLKPGMSRQELKSAVIELEKKEFLRQTGLAELRPGLEMQFTDTGRYDEVLRHIHAHKYYINQSKPFEIPFQEALLSWYDKVYEPLVRLVRSESILARFQGREAADLYVWIVGHWDVLKRQYGQGYPLAKAAEDFRRRFGRPVWNPLVLAWLWLRRRVGGS